MNIKLSDKQIELLEVLLDLDFTDYIEHTDYDALFPETLMRHLMDRSELDAMEIDECVWDIKVQLREV